MTTKDGEPPQPNQRVYNPNTGKHIQVTLDRAVQMWPTLTAVDRPNEGNVRLLRAKVLAGELTLEEATAMLGKSPMEAQGKVPMWPTPKATPGGADFAKLDRSATGISLETAVRLYPTPTAVDRPNEGNVRLLRAKVMAGELTEQEAEQMLGKSVWEAQGKVPAMFPTPDASPHKYRLQGSSQQSKSLNALAGGALNPTWVEWLMGFPAGWTDSNSSVTPSCRTFRT